LEDWRGTPLEIGSSVIWAVARSGNITMNEGVVIDLLPHSTTYGGTDYCRYCHDRESPNGRGSYPAAENCRGYNLRVLPVFEANSWSGEARKPTPVKLTALGRVTVMTS
jgi:hypothetical protein